MPRLLLIVPALLVALAALLGIRTLAAGGVAPVAPLEVPALAIDSAAAAGRLGEAVRLRTVVGEAGFESVLGDFHQWLATHYPAFHTAAERTVVGAGTLIYAWKGSEASLPPIILLAHQDVVPEVSPERWTHPPFSGAVAEGSIWGRGSIDNKGSLVAMLEAAEALIHAGHAPRRTLYLVFGHDEEAGGSGARAAAQWLAARQVRAQFVLDEGSLAIADHPVARRPVALIGLSEKGYATVRITARARGGHASAPPSRTAVGVLASAIEAIFDRPFAWRYDGATRAMLEALAPHTPAMTRVALANAWLFRPLLVRQVAATPQGAAMLHTTLAPTLLSGSPRANVLATEATATINVRIAPGDTVASVMEQLRRAVSGIPVTLEVEGDSWDPSAVSPIDSPGYRLVAGAARAVFDIPVAPAPVIAATDSRSFTDVSAHIYRFQPLQLPIAGTDMIHGVDEHLQVEALERMIRFYVALIVSGTGS